VAPGLADGQRINVDMNRQLAARVREGEAVTVRKRRTLPGRVAYAAAIPSRHMPPSGAAAGDAGVTALPAGSLMRAPGRSPARRPGSAPGLPPPARARTRLKFFAVAAAFPSVITGLGDTYPAGLPIPSRIAASGRRGGGLAAVRGGHSVRPGPEAMVATVLVGMLCVYSLSFSLMFLLISRRLGEDRMGMDAFAAGNLILGVAYVLQLLEPPGWSWLGVVNHSFTVGALVAYAIGGLRFFGRPAPLRWPLAAVLLGYAALQALAHWAWGPVWRYALLSATCALCFAGMIVALVAGLRSYARGLRGEVGLFVLLIGGILVLNLVKLGKLLSGGLEALAMDGRFQMVFYIYMCSLATILPPMLVWLVLRRLTDQLRAMAARDPLTGLLNRRGLDDAVAALFRRGNAHARLLLVDVDHFKHVNDRHGHQAGDAALCAIAAVLRGTARSGDLVCRMGGEEFAVVCLGADAATARQLGERIRRRIAAAVLLHDAEGGALRCTVTVGISDAFDDDASLARAMQVADAALYRGKQAGRDRVEGPGPASGSMPPDGDGGVPGVAAGVA